jgi:hypothetical protein
VTDALSALALPALPPASDETNLILAAVIASASVVVLGRTLLASRALARHARRAEALAEQLAAGRAEAALARARAQVATFNAATERTLWALPEADRRLTIAARRVHELGATATEFEAAGGTRATAEGVRRALEFVNTAGRIRRMVGR